MLSFCLAKPVLVMIFKGACSVWCSLGCCVMWPVTLLLLLLCRVWPVIAVLSTSVIMVSVHSCRLSCARQCFCRICRSELMVRYAVSIKAVLLSKMSCGFCMDFLDAHCSGAYCLWVQSVRFGLLNFCEMDKNKKSRNLSCDSHCSGGGTRTHDLRIMNPTL